MFSCFKVMCILDSAVECHTVPTWLTRHGLCALIYVCLRPTSLGIMILKHPTSHRLIKTNRGFQ